MALLSNQAARLALQNAVLKQHGICAKCDKKHDFIPLILDHVDGNRSHNPADGTNHQAICQSENVKKGKIQQKTRKQNSARRESVSEGGGSLSLKHFPGSNGGDPVIMEEMSPQSREMARADKWKPRFKDFLDDVVRKESNPRAKRILDGFSEVSGMSQNAISRWLDAACSPEGRFEYVKDQEDKWRVRKKQKEQYYAQLP